MKCVVCEKEFKSHDKNQGRVCCSRECGQSYNERVFKDKFNTKFAGQLEYVEGYINSDKSFMCRCLKCRKLLERSAQCIRANHKGVRCDDCYKVDIESNKTLRKLTAIKNQIKKEKEKELKLISKKEKQIEIYNVNHSKICITCDNKYIGTTMFCSDKCKRKYRTRSKEVRRRPKLKSNGRIQWDISLDKLIERDMNVCYLCGGKCDDKDYRMVDGKFIVGKNYPSIDHVLAVNKGGTHTWNNVKLAHCYCNTIKRDRDIYIQGNEQLVLVI